MLFIVSTEKLGIFISFYTSSKDIFLPANYPFTSILIQRKVKIPLESTDIFGECQFLWMSKSQIESN